MKSTNNNTADFQNAINVLRQQEAQQEAQEKVKIEQRNYYEMIDSNGRAIGNFVVASNLQDAYKQIKGNTPAGFWKLKRCYNGGVRGLD